MTREDALVCSVLELLDKKKAWQESGEIELSQTFMSATDDCISLFNAGETPRDCHELFRIVDRLKTEWMEFQVYATGRSGPDPRPRATFWKCLTELENSLTFAPPEVQPFEIESIAELVAAKVTLWQIAVMYSHEGRGPFMSNEAPPQPLPVLVKREINTPGSVLPKDFVHPKILADKEKLARYENRIARRAMELRALGDYSAQQSTAGPVGPESIEELLLQRVPDNQICTIKHCTLTEVLTVKSRLAAEAAGGCSADPAANEAQVMQWIEQNPDAKNAKNAEIADAVGCEVKIVAAVRRKMKELTPAN